MGFFSPFFNKSTQIQKQLEISWVRGEKQPRAWAASFWCNGVSLGRGAVLGVLGRVYLHTTDLALIYPLLDTNNPLALAGDPGKPPFPSLCILQAPPGPCSCARAAVTLMDHSHQAPCATSVPLLQPLCSTPTLPSAKAQLSMPTHPCTSIFCWMTTLCP